MRVFVSIGAASLFAVSFAQFSDNFESENGSATGTPLTNGFGGGGQNGWYNPISGTIDSNVFTYAGNSLGFATNPLGGSQFDGMSMATGTNRAQHDVNFSAGGTWTLSYDFAGNFSGTPPAADNLASVSLQPSGASNYFQTIFQWGTGITLANHFDANIGWAPAAGTAGAIGNFSSPDPAFMNLPLNNWFRMTVTWSFATNQLLSTSIRNLTTGGSTTTVDLTGNGWYLTGGANNVLAQATPTAFRLFGSGSTGDLFAYDNAGVSPVPEPASMTALAVGALALIRRRRNGKK